jgi:hypothetical protein
VRLAEGDVPLTEQYASAGAGLGYALFAARSLGFGAMAVSGDKLQSNAMRDAFRLAANESLLCFIGIGTPEKLRGPRDEFDISTRVRRWRPAVD